LTNANNNTYGVYFIVSNNNTIYSLTTTGNSTGGIGSVTGRNFIFRATIGETPKVAGYTDFAGSRLFSQSQGGVTTANWIYTDGGTINSEATDRVGGTGIMWNMAITSANRASNYPLKLAVAHIACVADKLVTVKMYMKKSHASNIQGKLICRKAQLAGLTTDAVTDTTTNADTNWHEYTITFQPTEVGVVEIEAYAYYVAGNASVYVEDMTFSQAD
jgi:hypothetical protein